MIELQILKDKESKSTLPQGWRWVKLSELSELTGGNGAPQDLDAFIKGKIPFVRMRDVGKYRFTLNLTDTEDYLNDDAINKFKMRIFPPGTILMPRSGSVYTNHRARLGVHAAVVGHLAALLPNDNVFDSEYVTLALSLVDMRQWMAKTTGLDSISFKELSQVEVPLPSLKEQRRIASILKKHLSSISKAKAATEAQLEAAEALPAAYLREVFNSPEAKKWPKDIIGNIFRVKSGEFLSAKNMKPDGIFPVYGGNGINGYHDEYMFEDSKIVIGRVGALCGCIHISEPKAWITDNALYISEKNCALDNQFVAINLRYLNLNRLSNSMAQPLVSGKVIYAQEIFIPPLEVQQRVAEEYFNKVGRIERPKAVLEDQKKGVNFLLSAILRQAFSGEL